VKRGGDIRQSGGVVEVVLASVAVLVAVVALVVALTRESGADKAASPTVVTSTTLSAVRLCQANAAAYDAHYRFLDAQRVALKNQADSLNDQENAALAAHAQNTGPIDAQHQAVLRELEDVETRMLRLETSKPQRCR
jgi:hypothetical protein